MITPDRIILASVMEPQKDAQRLSQMLEIPFNEDRFFMEAHVKLRTVNFSLINHLTFYGISHCFAVKPVNRVTFYLS